MRTGDGIVEIHARKPLSKMSVKQAAKVLGTTEWNVRHLYRLGILKGEKPGAIKVRRDGRASNAALVLYSESVLLRKEQQRKQAEAEQRRAGE